MEKSNTNDYLLDTRCWANVLEGIEYAFKGWVRDVVEDVISDKMCNAQVEDQRLNVEELCARWNISPNTLHNWEKEGIITPLPIGGRKKVYSMADVHNAEALGNIA